MPALIEDQPRHGVDVRSRFSLLCIIPSILRHHHEVFSFEPLQVDVGKGFAMREDYPEILCCSILVARMS